MKIKYIFVCLLASMGIVNAQYQNYDLQTTNDAANTYIGRDYVRLLPGYSFKAGTGSIMNAKVQSGLTPAAAANFLSIANPTNSPTVTPETLTAINTSAAVGQIPISSSVSPSGAKCYNVPIEIVPGRQGFQPNISLSYNSQAGNGVVGIGWNINGLSSIERVNKNMFFDGMNDIPALTIEDVFTLDGVRLIKNIQTSTSTVFNFETVTGNTQVIAYVNGDIIKYFKVLYPNGSVGIMGYTSNTTSKLSYPITTLTDLNGSKITFSYNIDETGNTTTVNSGGYISMSTNMNNEVYYIDEINYGKCADKLDFSKIKFSYESRSDEIFSLQSTTTCIYRKRLSKIESFANTDLIRTYSLSYSNNDPRLPSNQNDVSRLKQISSFINTGSSVTDNLNPLKFYYGESGTISTSVQSTTLINSNFDLTKINIVRGKFDLNNHNDAFLVYPKKDFFTGNYLTGYVLTYPTQENIKVYQNLNGSISTPYNITSEQGFLGVYSADIDGVGSDKIIKINSTAIIQDREILKFKIYKSNPSLGIVLDRELSLSLSAITFPAEAPYPSVTTIIPKEFYTGNFTGHGKTDILCVPIEIPASSSILSFDGSNINVVNGGKLFSKTSNTYIYPMDIDGDGQTEIVYVRTTNTKVYKYKSGSGFVDVATWVLTKSDFDNRQIQFSDLNGDGKTDIIMSPKAATTYCYTYNNVTVGSCVKCPYCGGLNGIIDPVGMGPSYPGAKCSNCNIYLDYSVLHPNWATYIPPGTFNVQNHRCCVICGQNTPWNGTCPTHGVSVSKYNYYFTLSGTYDKKWRYLYSNGLGTPLVIEKDFVNREYNHQYSIQDIDGDNTPELIVNMNGGIKIYPYRDNNQAFDITPISTFNISNASELLSLDIVSQTMNYDVNSEKNFSQLIALTKTGIDKYTFSQNQAKNNQISLMINSLGIADKTNYDQLHQGANYIPGTTATFPNTDFQGPLWVTTQNSVMYNKQLISNTTYNYTGAILHKQGLGLRGFTSMKATDLMTNKVVSTEFDPYKMGAVVKQTSDREESTFDYTFTNYSNATGGIKKMKLQLNNKTVTDKMKSNTATVTYTDYDDYGNVGTEVTNFSGDILNKSTIENAWDNKVNGNIYMLGMLTNRKTTTERGTKTFVQNEGYEYYDETKKFRLQFIRKSVYKNGQTKMPLADTEYKYNVDYGTLSEETVHNTITNNAADDLTTSYTYWDDDKCSLKTKTDPMGLVTSYSYYPGTRLLKDVTDYLGNTVTYSYDNWRRKNSEVSKVGTDIITTTLGLVWNTESEPKRLIQQTTTTTGQPTVTTYVDVFGRETRKAIAGFKIKTNVFADKEYDNFGHLKSSSAPYNSTESPLWTTYDYDKYDRPLKVLQPNGSTTTYTYTGNTVSENKNGVATSKTTDSTGKTTATTDAGGEVKYTYKADGQPESVDAAGVVTSFEYDDYGRQNKLIDPSAGTIQTDYNDAIHTITQTMNSGKIITTVTNKYGQPITKTTPDFTTTYSYDPTYKRPTGSTTTNGTSKGIEYDTYGRLWKSTETVSGKTYQEVYGYDKGRIGNINYNTGTESLLTNLTSVVYKYNGNGYLYRLEDAACNRLCEVDSVNELGQEKSVLLGNGLTTTKNYTPEGLWTNVTTSNGIQNMNYDFNRINGTLTSRTDVTRGLSESFAYDGLYRLKSFGSKTMDYYPNGNINTKSDVGAESIYKYNDDTNTKPYTLFKIYNATTVDLANQLDIDYTVMSRPTSIRNTSTGLSATFTYNDGYDRATMQIKQGTTVTMNKTYFGGGKYEIETVGGIEKQRLYVDGSPYNASVLLEKTGASAIQSYYLHRDYLGSITQITNNSGNFVTEYSYDAWGRMRNPLNWTAYPQGLQPTMSYGMRGYTGHEQLNQFGIINMNARLYDPVLARFLAPDPYVGSGLTNDFNRYIYCRNNPLMFIDPSGESPWSWIKDQWNNFSNFMNKTFPNGFEIGYGAGLPGNNGRGFFYNGNLNGNSSFGGNYKNGTFTTTSNYNGYVSNYTVYSQKTDQTAYQVRKAEQAGIQTSQLINNLSNGTGIFISVGQELKYPSKIAYTTLQGTEAFVSSKQVLGVLEGATKYNIYAGTVVEGLMVLSGKETFVNFGNDTGVYISLYVISAAGCGVPALFLTVGWVMYRNGAFDRVNFTPEYHENNYVPNTILPQDAIKPQYQPADVPQIMYFHH
jgi:RHS repeat-associated protein